MRAPQAGACGAPISAGVAGTQGENVTAAGRTSLPGKPSGRPRSANTCAAPWSGAAARAGCTTGWLRSWNRPGDLLHRRRRTGSGRTGGHARAGGGGVSPLGAAWARHDGQRSASAWAWPTVAATPEEPPVSHLPDAFRAAVVYDLAGCRGMPPELGPASSLLDPLRDHAPAATCGDAQLGRALAPGSSSLPSLAPNKVKDRDGCLRSSGPDSRPPPDNRVRDVPGRRGYCASRTCLLSRRGVSAYLCACLHCPTVWPGPVRLAVGSAGARNADQECLQKPQAYVILCAQNIRSRASSYDHRHTSTGRWSGSCVGGSGRGRSAAGLSPDSGDAVAPAGA